MAEPTVEEYLRTLHKSRLLPKELLSKTLTEFKEATGVRKKSELSVQKVADYFIQHKLLTQWQHQKLLSGHYQGFYLGKYRLLRHLGSGGMSNVYLAEHQHMQRKVAIKVLPRLLVQNEMYLKRFYLEARAIAALDHPHIVQAFHFDNEGDTHYMVMQYIEGVDLCEQIVQNGPLDAPTAAYYIQQAAEGLQHAHDRGLIHRDIKPANLMVDKEGIVRLMDLGLAQMSFHQTNLTEEQKGAVLGTADFLAPEQAVDSHNIDARADQYSLGCTLYYLLTGQAPFPKGTIAQRLVAHQVETPPAIEEFRTDVPSSLIHVVNKLMSKKPEHRYESCEEVAEVLAAWIDQQGEAATAAISQASSLLLIPDFSDAWEVKENRSPFAMESNSRSFSGLSLPSSTGSSQEIAVGRDNSMVLALVAAACLLMCAIGIFVWATGTTEAQKSVILEWPEGERDGASVTIDGKPFDVPIQGEVRFPVGSESPKIEIIRPGFETVRTRVDLSDKLEARLSPEWTLEPDARRRNGLKQLAEQIAAWEQIPSLSDRLKQREDLSKAVRFFNTQWPNTAESAQAHDLLTSLSKVQVPWDKLNGETVPEEVLKLPNSGPLVAILGETSNRLNHNARVHVSKYSPDGNYLLTCAESDLPRLWSADQSVQPLRAPGAKFFPAKQYRGAGFINQGNQIAVLAFTPRDGEEPFWAIHLWDTKTKVLQGTIPASGTPPDMMLTAHESKFAITIHGQNCYRWNTKTKTQDAALQLPVPESFSGQLFVTPSPNGETLAVSVQPLPPGVDSTDVPPPNQLFLLDWEGNQETITLSDAAIQNFTFNNSSDSCFILDAQSKFYRYDLKTKTHDVQCNLSMPNVSSLGGFLSEAASLLLTIDTNGTFRSWNIQTGELVNEYYLGTTPLWLPGVDMHPAGGEFTLTHAGSWQVRKLPLGTNTEDPGHTVANLGAMAFSPDGTSLTTVAADGKMIHWNAATAKPSIQQVDHLAGGHIQYSPQSQLIAKLDTAGQFCVLNAESHNLVLQTSLSRNSATNLLAEGAATVVQGPGFDETPIAWCLHPTRRSVLFSYLEAGTSKYGSFMLTNFFESEFAGPTSVINAVAYQPGGKRFASTTFNPQLNAGEVRIHDAAKGNVILREGFSNSQIHAMRFSPSGRYLGLIGSGGAVILFDTTDDRFSFVESFSTSIKEPFRSIVFDPTEEIVVLQAFDSAVSVWRLPAAPGTGATKLAEFKLPIWGSPIVQNLASMEISPEGRHLAVPNFDGTVWIYRLDFEAEDSTEQQVHAPRF